MIHRIRIALLSLLLATGCKTNAQTQAEKAVDDVQLALKNLDKEHAARVKVALPPAAEFLLTKFRSTTPIYNQGKSLIRQLEKYADDHEDLRAVRRSYFAIVNTEGRVVAVDDMDNWSNVVDRDVKQAFPCVEQAIANPKYAECTGKYGGLGDQALSLARLAPIYNKDKQFVGLLMLGWDIHDTATDIQRTLRTRLIEQTPLPKSKKESTASLIARLVPDLWVAFYRGNIVYSSDKMPQYLETAIADQHLGDKMDKATFKGTFFVEGREWGYAATRTTPLEDLGIVVVRLQP